jgi:hypothetical protein
MKGILKPIFEWIVDQYDLFENPLYNWIVATIVGAIGFAVAWNFVGNRYRDGSIRGSTAGSILHWMARFISVTLMYLCIAGVIWAIKLIISVPWWGWLIVLGVIAGGAVFSIIAKRKHEENLVHTEVIEK